MRFYSIDILKNKTEYHFHLKDFDTIYQDILRSTKEERMQMPGLIAMRVDMIVVSSILLNLIIESLNIKRVRSSTYSLKEGILHQLLS